MKGKLEEAQVFTTGEVAGVLHCAPRTVNRLFDEGKLKGYTIPGGGHRRVPRESLLAFLKQYQMAIPDWLRATGE